MSSKESDEFRKESDVEDLAKYEDMDKETLRKTAMTEFSIDPDEWKEGAESEPLFGKETVDEIANISYFAEKLENSLRGKQLIKSGKGEEKYIQKSKAIAGESLINSCVSIVNTFANKSMLISDVKEEDFNMQFEDAFRKISDKILMKETSVDADAIRTILKQFKDIFWNLGSILTKTGKNMDSYFNSLKREHERADSFGKSGLGD